MPRIFIRIQGRTPVERTQWLPFDSILGRPLDDQQQSLLSHLMTDAEFNVLRSYVRHPYLLTCSVLISDGNTQVPRPGAYSGSLVAYRGATILEVTRYGLGASMTFRFRSAEDTNPVGQDL